MANDDAPRPGGATPGAVAGNPIEAALNEVSGKLGAAERDKEYKARLDTLLQASTSALDEYSGKKYQDLRKRWEDQDETVKKLLADLVAGMPQWESQLKAAVAPLFARLLGLKQQLGARTEPATPAQGPEGLYSRRDRQQVRLAVAQARCDEAWTTLLAWSSPAKNIEKVLNENDKTAAEIRKSIGQPEAPARLYDLFFKLLPLHWLVAPPSAQVGVKARDYVAKAAGEDAWAALLEMLGPQPRLVEPAGYLAGIGQDQLAGYTRAQAALATADGDLKRTLEEIKRAEKALAEPLKALEKNARAALLDPTAGAAQAGVA